MYQAQRVRIVKCGVAKIAFVNTKILMKINPELPLAVPQIIDANASEKDVFMARDGIVTCQLNAESFVVKRDIGD